MNYLNKQTKIYRVNQCLKKCYNLPGNKRKVCIMTCLKNMPLRNGIKLVYKKKKIKKR